MHAAQLALALVLDEILTKTLFDFVEMNTRTAGHMDRRTAGAASGLECMVEHTATLVLQ